MTGGEARPARRGRGEAGEQRARGKRLAWRQEGSALRNDPRAGPSSPGRAPEPARCRAAATDAQRGAGGGVTSSAEPLWAALRAAASLSARARCLLGIVVSATLRTRVGDYISQRISQVDSVSHTFHFRALAVAIERRKQATASPSRAHACNVAEEAGRALGAGRSTRGGCTFKVRQPQGGRSSFLCGATGPRAPRGGESGRDAARVRILPSARPSRAPSLRPSASSSARRQCPGTVLGLGEAPEPRLSLA